jgi:hypothetical protein
MPRSQIINRALPKQSRLSLIITIAILVLGAVVLIWVISPGERRRRELMERLDFGDPGTRVSALLGEPTECPIGTLDHLRGSFPEGWPPPAAEAALERLTAETTARWVYSLDAGDAGECGGADGQTEIGLDADSQVLWYVAITGKTGLRLPGEYTPGTDGS